MPAAVMDNDHNIHTPENKPSSPKTTKPSSLSLSRVFSAPEVRQVDEHSSPTETRVPPHRSPWPWNYRESSSTSSQKWEVPSSDPPAIPVEAGERPEKRPRLHPTTSTVSAENIVHSTEPLVGPIMMKY